MNARRTLSFVIALLALVAAVLLSADSGPGGEPRPPTDELAPKRVAVATIEALQKPREARFSGVTRAALRGRLGFAIGGRIERRLVDIGDRVRRGQLLAELDDDELENTVASATSTVAELTARRAQQEREQQRVTLLAEAKAATREELEQADAAVEALRAAEDAARARLRETEHRRSEARLVAPFDGTVLEVLHEPGEVVAPGQGVVSLSGNSAVEIEVELPESMILEIEVGEPVMVLLGATRDQPLRGHITSVGRGAAGPGQLFPVIVSLEHDRLVSGMTAELMFEMRGEDTLALPVEAVVNPGGRRPTVFRLVEGSPLKVERVVIEVLDLVDEKVTVKGELAPGDRVVIGGLHNLLDGDSVEVDG